MEKPTSSTKAYADPSGALTCGVLRSKPQRPAVDSKHDEFCLIVEGKVHLTDANGRIEIYRQGDGFIVPAGFGEVWDMSVPVTKFYVLHAARPSLPTPTA